jgi:hypothetical protein|tara:strand:+ start:252 stop:491 length:240 start_codon:yes stop_codon:yes gene_type:complete
MMLTKEALPIIRLVIILPATQTEVKFSGDPGNSDFIFFAKKLTGTWSAGYGFIPPILIAAKASRRKISCSDKCESMLQR